MHERHRTEELLQFCIPVSRRHAHLLNPQQFASHQVSASVNDVAVLMGILH
jgi:hypothetical protein